jgi:DeoR/GlpR family transcriptional regulator of sugar metabolism
MTLFIDAGSTNLAIAHAIPADIRLTVITNAPAIAMALLDSPQIELILIGGTFDRQTGAVIGGKALSDAEMVRTDLCILGSCGIELASGVSASLFEEAAFKRLIAARSKATVAAVTREKLGLPAPYAVLPLSKLSHLIVESDTDPETVEAIEAMGPVVIHAESVS